MPQRGERSLADHNHFKHSTLFLFSEKKEKLQLCCEKNNPASSLNRLCFVSFFFKWTWSLVVLMWDPSDYTAAPPSFLCIITVSRDNSATLLGNQPSALSFCAAAVYFCLPPPVTARPPPAPPAPPAPPPRPPQGATSVQIKPSLVTFH